MSQALYRKWRPARFEDMVGQTHVTQTLQNSVAADRVGHAYLFCGPRGTGKTTSARLLAKAVNCLHEERTERPCNQCSICQAISQGRFLDLIEIDAASNTGVDDIRDLRDKINFAPSEGRFKVYIIDEVHMLSTAAFNALLKTLEEPPPHAKFVLATTEEHKVPLTIKSRCQQFNFRLLSTREIIGRLEWLAAQENLTIEPEALTLIANQGAGSVRDAESLLDQLVTAPGVTITLQQTQTVLGTATDTAVTDLTDAWLDGDGAAGLGIIHDALAAGTDARQFARQMVTYLRRLLLLQAAGEQLPLDLPADRKAALLAQAERTPRQRLIDAIKGFSEAALTQASSWQPQLPLEMAFIELLPERPFVAPAPTPAPTATPQPAMRPQQPANQPTSQPANQPTNQPTSQPANQPTNQPTSQPANQPTNQPASQPANQPTNQPASQPANQPTSQPTSQPANQPTNQPANQPLTLASVQTHWRTAVAQVSEQNRNLPALLNMSKPLAVEGDVLVLGFDYPIFKEKFQNSAGAAQLLGAALSTLMNTQCTVRPVVTSDYTVPVNKAEVQELAQELGGIVREEKE